MVNLLIVDDFNVDRQNIIEMINSFGDSDINIIGECENGTEALEFINENSVDIIITDIEMPFMNGLELAKNVNVKYPNIKLIFCSLYDEFEYARKAIYLNTCGYILKPLDRDELLKCLKDVIAQLADEKGFEKEYQKLKDILNNSKPQLLDNLMREIIYGTITSERDILDKLEYLGAKIEKGYYILAYIEIDDYAFITKNMTIEQKQLFTIRVHEKLREVLAEFDGPPIIILDDSHFAYLINAAVYDDVLEGRSKFTSRAFEVLKLFDISITISISDVFFNIEDSKTFLQQCIYIMRYKFILGNGKVLNPQDIPSGTYSHDIDFNAMHNDIRFLLNSGCSDDIHKYVDNLLKRNSEILDEDYFKGLCFSVIMCTVFVLNENNEDLNSFFKDTNIVWENLLKFETITDTHNWMENLLLFVNSQLLSKANSKYSIIVERIKGLIEKNYMKSLSIEIIADELNYSPNYLSYVFKKECGETIADYITKIKIEKAKEMLLDIRNKIYNVSETLGFSNAAYFCSVFKKATSMTPNEYREKQIKKIDKLQTVNG